MPKSVFADDYRTLIARLVELRAEAGLTQVELATRLGRPQSYISKIERCERRLDVVEFCQLVGGMGRDPVATLAAFLDVADAS